MKSNIGIYPYLENDDSLFVKSGNNIYFKLTQNGLSSIWKTDGTINGTIMVHDISTETFYGNIVVMNNALFYLTKSTDPVWQTTTVKLWKYNTATNVTTVVYNWNSFSTFSSGGNANLFGDIYSPFLRAYNNKIYFLGWQSDGTTINTIQTSVSLPYSRWSCLHNGLIYYTKGNGIGRTDGTPSGTFQVVTDFPIYEGAVVYNGLIYFAGGNIGSGLQGVEICSSDGTTSNTSVIKDIQFGYYGSYPRDFFVFNGSLYFDAYESTLGLELYKSDGTSNGTSILSDINLGAPNSFEYISSNSYNNNYIPDNKRSKIEHLNMLYFNVNTDIENNNTSSINGIWKSDGTTSNTTQVFQIDTTRSLIDVNGKLFFAGYTANEGWELYAEGLTADINESLVNPSISIYPNPTSHSITIKGETNMNQPFQIFDQMGREVFKGKLTGAGTDVNLSSLTKGIYTLKIEGNYQPAQIVKE